MKDTYINIEDCSGDWEDDRLTVYHDLNNLSLVMSNYDVCDGSLTTNILINKEKARELRDFLTNWLEGEQQ